MKHKALRASQLVLGLVLFAAGTGPSGGFDLVVQQIAMVGARQWLGLVAGSAIAPVSERIAAALPRQLAPPASGDLPSSKSA
jgi:hypothetical protein